MVTAGPATDSSGLVSTQRFLVKTWAQSLLISLLQGVILMSKSFKRLMTMEINLNQLIDLSTAMLQLEAELTRVRLDGISLVMELSSYPKKEAEHHLVKKLPFQHVASAL